LLPEGAGLPAYVTRDYFAYQGDGPGNVFVGAEVGPDFQPISWQVLCSQPDQSISSQTVTLAEWKQALVQGKRLAAVAASDRHFGFTPFRSRTTVVFTGDRTAQGVLEALLARRSMAANLEPFDVRFAVDDAIVGGTAVNPSNARVLVSAPPAEVQAIEVWKGDELLESFSSEAVNRDLTVSLQGRGPGAVWVRVTGVELDPDTGTPRTTITSPIWIEVR
jgi:hypothetical protein